MKTVPPAHITHCYFCGESIDTRATGIFQFVSGWIEQRMRGGANTVAIPKREHKWACANCIDRLRHGIPAGQMHLFDGQ